MSSYSDMRRISSSYMLLKKFLFVCDFPYRLFPRLLPRLLGGKVVTSLTTSINAHIGKRHETGKTGSIEHVKHVNLRTELNDRTLDTRQSHVQYVVKLPYFKTEAHTIRFKSTTAATSVSNTFSRPPLPR